MKFRPVLVGEAEDTLLAHSLRAGDIMLAKGHRLTATDVAALAALGVSEVVAVRLDANDLPEDEAAARIAAAITPSHLQFSTATTDGSTSMRLPRDFSWPIPQWSIR